MRTVSNQNMELYPCHTPTSMGESVKLNVPEMEASRKDDFELLIPKKKTMREQERDCYGHDHLADADKI